MTSTVADASAKRRSPFRRLYDWTLHWAATPYGVAALMVVAFVEASFFPIPPDVLLLAIALANPKRGWKPALLCGLASTCGGLFGWTLGYGFWQVLGAPADCAATAGGGLVFRYVPGFTCELFERVSGLYQDHAALALLTAAFTPIPFKVFTVTAGVVEVPLFTLAWSSLLGRTARFMLLALLIAAFGPKVRQFLETRFELATLILGILLVGGFLVLKWVL